MMRVGVPKEIKVHEYRVGLTPASVAELVAAGHEVLVETNAGTGIDCPDQAYREGRRDDPPRRRRGVQGGGHDRQGQGAAGAGNRAARAAPLLFTYLHLAADKPQAEGPDEVRRDLHRL